MKGYRLQCYYKQLHLRFFSECVPEVNCLKRNILRKKCVWCTSVLTFLKKRWKSWCIFRKTSLKLFFRNVVDIESLAWDFQIAIIFLQRWTSLTQHKNIKVHQELLVGLRSTQLQVTVVPITNPKLIQIINVLLFA